MADEVYSIKIHLGVEDDELNAAENRMRDMERRRGAAGYTSRTSRRAAAYRYRRAGLEGGQRDFIARMTRFERAVPGLIAATPLAKGLANVNRAMSTLDRDFARNLFSIGGFRRNLGNLTNVMAQTGGAMINAIPALKSLATGLGAFVAVKGAGMAINGGIMLAGKKVLMGQNLGDAATNIMQFNAARMGLGPAYDEVYRRGSEIASTYGFSRAGIIQSANILSGIHVNGKPLGTSAALDLAGIAGKLAQSGGVDYNRVSLNLQQLLGQPTVNQRDLRELIGQAPLVAKIAQQRMKATTGKVGDVREYLKDKSKLLDVLYEFDRQMQAHPIMKMRGAVTLSKESLWMQIAESGGTFFKDISDAVITFNKMIEGRVVKYASMYKAGSLTSMLDDFTKSVGAVMDSIVTAIPKIMGTIELADNNINTLTGAFIGNRFGKGKGWLGRSGLTIAAGLASAGGDVQSRYNKENAAAYETSLNTRVNSILYALADEKARVSGILPETITKYRQGPIIGQAPIPYTVEDPDGKYRAYLDSIVNNMSPAFRAQVMESEAQRSTFGTTGPQWYKNTIGQVTPYIPLLGSSLDAAGGVGFSYYNLGTPESTPWDEYKKMYNEDTKNQDQATKYDDYLKKLTDAAGERKSLTINFEREVVNFGPTNITATDAIDLANQVGPLIEEKITSGINRALNTATALAR
jgi:hypothetical protein